MSRQRPVVLMSLELPEPAGSMLRSEAELRVLGSIPSHELLASELARGVDVFCSQLRDRVSASILASGGSRLKAVCNYAAGYDNIDVSFAAQRGIVVTNTPDAVTEATAEFTIALMLAAARRIVEGDRELRAGRFTGWAPTYLLGTGLAGKTLGIVGLGAIGRAVAKKAEALGMTVRHARSDDREVARGSTSISQVTFSELFASSDVVSLHAPMTDRTRGLVNAEMLAAMKPTAILVNTARGALVDEAALAEALESGQLRAAALDVYEREPAVHARLLGLSSVVLAPHLGTATAEARSEMARVCAANVLAVLRGEDPPNPAAASAENNIHR